VKKRVMFRYNEGFKHAFNPSSLQEDGRNIKKALNKCLLELIEFLSHDLAQELRATTLRIENYINQQLQTIVSLDEKDCKSAELSISFNEMEEYELSSPKISSEIEMLDMSKLTKSLSIFKSGKQFFEQDGSTKMKESLEGQLDETMAKQLDQTLNYFIEHYLKQQESKRQSTVNSMLELLDDYQVGKMAAFDISFNVNEVKEIFSEIQSQKI
jgi:flagellin-specific chaperone FliS